MLEIVGASFTELTVSRKFVPVVALPSLTETVIVAVPFWFAAGVIVRVRFAPLPPKTKFAFGTRVGLDELPFTVKLPTAVSASPTVNAIAAPGVSSLAVWLTIAEIVGGVFGPTGPIGVAISV